MAFSVDGSKFATGGVVSNKFVTWTMIITGLLLLVFQMSVYIADRQYGVLYYSITGWACKNFEVAEFAHHFGRSKSTQFCQGYGF
jgi:hypothetical protein